MSPREQVESVLHTLRDAMQVDGGGVELVDLCEGKVSVRLRGTCLLCPSASLTLKVGIEATLKRNLAWVTEVVRVI